MELKDSYMFVLMQFLFLGPISGFVYSLVQSSHTALKMMVLLDVTVCILVDRYQDF
jgi:hypothetical protein